MHLYSGEVRDVLNFFSIIFLVSHERGGMDNGFSNLREFGDFRLDVEKKVLWWNGAPVNLPPKEVELLSVLTDNAGEVVTKNELMDRLWADSFVEESNLSRHVYRLRRILEERGEQPSIIETVPRRGYRFAGKVSDAGPSVIIECHSVSRTLIEELDRSDAPELRASATKPSYMRLVFLLVPVLLLGGVATALFVNSPSPKANSARASIAVIPPRSTGVDDHALAIGISDTLITTLSDIERLNVLSSSAVERYSGGTFDTKEEGRKLGVDLVVDGTLQRANNKVRLNLRVTRVADGTQVWSGSFEEADTDLFRLQDVVAQQTGKAILATLNIEDRQLSMKRYTSNPAAYEAYLRGRYLLSQIENQKAAGEFQRALQIDPRYALAYAGLADTLARLANRSRGAERIELYEQAKLKAAQAIEIDPNLAEGHAAMGWLNRIYDWEWESSERHIQRAIELAPNEAANHRRLAFLYVTLGRTDEALKASEHARMLDPLDRNHAWVLYCARRYEASAAEYQTSLYSNTSEEIIRDSKMGTAMSFLEIGRTAEAIRQLHELVEMEPGNFAVTAFLAIAHFKDGDKEKTATILKWLEKETAEGPGRWARLAYVYAAIGNRAKALKALELAVETRDDRLMWIKTTPYFDPFRNDPRFVEILRKMRLS